MADDVGVDPTLVTMPSGEEEEDGDGGRTRTYSPHTEIAEKGSGMGRPR